MNKFEKAIEAVCNGTASLPQFGDACKQHITINEIKDVYRDLQPIFQYGDIVVHKANNGTKYFVIASGYLITEDNRKEGWIMVSNENHRTFYKDNELILLT